jgi:hypothetical protein
MKLNTKALMTAGGIGAVVQIVLTLCSGTILFLPLAGDSVDVAMLGMLGIAGTVLACCGWIINLAIGFGYVYFAAQTDGSVQVADGAVGGAAATAIAAVIGGLVSACLTIVAPFAIAASAGGSPDAVTIITNSIASVAGAVCGGLIGGAVVGAIGGLIGALTIGKPKA